MKPFDLQEALNGAPVKLRNDNKAFITFNLSNLKDWSKVTDRPLIGYSLNKSGSLEGLHSWTLCGWSAGLSDIFDIVGMYEEPKLTSEQVLEKAYQENLPLDAIGKKAFVIAKTKDGDYVMQCGEDNLYFASHETEWKFYKDPAPKSNTITVTLPKPFKPKSSDKYYHFVLDYKKYRISEEVFGGFNAEVILAGNGLCFRAREDAKAWLDAMKNALRD